ncbi:MAG: SH3 domain-containing protein [Treponema sp.]|nr:SH3 domain-containing protein [Treponema sp.]
MKKTLILFTAILLFTVNTFAASSKLIMLRDNGPLRRANETNGVEWATSVKAGTELDLESTQIFVKDLVTASKTYKDVKFYKVKYNKNTYYVQESDAEPSNSVSVIQKDALLFSKPTLSSFRNAVLETGTLCVAQESVAEFNTTFVKIAFYDTNDGLKRIRYVNSENISNSDKDVKAVILLENARANESEDLKKEFLNNASSMKTSPLISEYIRVETAKILKVSSFSDDSIVSIDGYTAHIKTTDGSKVNVRSLPGTAGEVIGKFESAEEPTVFVSMKTEDTEEIGGVTASWYYVSQVDTDTLEVVNEGIEGWVFGAFIE